MDVTMHRCSALGLGVDLVRIQTLLSLPTPFAGTHIFLDIDPRPESLL
jgi:hypothetical protein